MLLKDTLHEHNLQRHNMNTKNKNFYMMLGTANAQPHTYR